MEKGYKILFVILMVSFSIGSAYATEFHYDDSWSLVAAPLGSGTTIRAMTVYDNGSGLNIYGGTTTSGLLVRYNVTSGTWTQVASQYASEQILALTTYDDGTGSKIYASTTNHAVLLKYNTTLGGWSRPAVQPGTETSMYSLVVYNDGTGNAIYGGSGANGRLYKYNATLAGWSQVAAKYGSETGIYSTVIYNDGTGDAIYGGTSGTAALLKYNITLGAWSLVSAGPGAETIIVSLVTYNDGTGDAIYGASYPHGRLYKYNTTLGAWSQIAAQLGSETTISLATFNDGLGNAIYGGTGPGGRLYKYNTTLGSVWTQVAAPLGAETSIRSLVTYDAGTGLRLYGGTGANGSLYQYNTYTSVPPVTDFFANVTSGPSPLPVSFTDISKDTPTGWSWFFGDETYTQPWILKNASAGWTGRFGLTSAVLHDNSVVLMGGYDSGGLKNDVWRSTDDGVTWTQMSASAGWAAREGLRSVAMPDGSIIITGGVTSTAYKNDVWRSTDKGATWTQMNASAGWSGRSYHTSGTLSDGSIIIMGGSGSSFYNDVWRSTDSGARWTRINASAGWSARYRHTSAVLTDGSIVLMGGDSSGTRMNDVWRSTDQGITWTQMNASAGWTARIFPTSVAMPDNSVVIMAGHSGVRNNDVWRSSDVGSTWTRINASAGWTPRNTLTSVLTADGSVLLMGGYDDNYKNDVWKFSPSSSSLQSPIHTYVGTVGQKFSVSLQAFNLFGYNLSRRADYITITSTTPVAGFTANVTSGTPPLPVLFTDTSTNTPTSWNWSFNNITGNNTEIWWTTVQSPVLTFGIGNFSIKLNATSSMGSNISAQVTFINVSAAPVPVPPVASFNPNSTSGVSPLPVLFTDTSTNTPTSWNWSFKDVTGNNTEIWWSTSQNPVKTFNSGNFSIKLNATSSAGSNISAQTTFINVSAAVVIPIVVNFTSDVTSGSAPLSVSFTDSTTGSPTGWTWFFGDEPYTQVWSQQNASAGWTGRFGASSVTLPDGSIVLMGGNDGGYKNDVWRSTDKGVIWTRINSSAGWEAREYPSSLVLPDGSIILMGGTTSVAYKNDVWKSTDKGTTWTRINSSAGWTARTQLSSAVMPDGSVIIMGGTGAANQNDVWRSTDAGITWIQMNASAGWVPRSSHSSVALADGSIVLMGGYDGSTSKNDVWRSTDNGVIWTQLNASAGWTERRLFSSVSMPDGSIVLMGGFNWNIINFRFNDVWRSTDKGVTWTRINAGAGWVGRNAHSSVVIPDGNIILMGGYDGSNYKNDVWSFNPSGSSLQNPIHTYVSFGNYSVVLQAYNSDKYNATIPGRYWINVSPVVPTASFTSSVTSGNEPLSVSFVDTSTDTPTAWNWSFRNVIGNNTEVWWTTTQSPLHTFGAGNFSIKLNASNSAGYNISAQITFINVSTSVIPTPTPTPVPTGVAAQFDASPRTGNASMNVSFTDLSTGYPTTWNWSFGDGIWTNGTTQNPFHLYTLAGSYSITLVVNSTETNHSLTKNNFIFVYPEVPPTAAISANFVGSPLRGSAPMNVSFTDVSDGYPTSWNWSFGDGNFSEEQNPTNEYITPGIYTVSLNASTMTDYNISIKTSYLIVWAPTPTPTPTPTPVPTPVMITAQFVASPLSGSNPLFVSFTDLSTGPPTAWNWSFGDLTYDTTQYPTHTYSSVGNYTVELFVSNTEGNSTAIKANYIVVVAPTPTTAPTYALPFTAQFVGTPLTGSAPLDVSFTDLTAGGPPTAWDWSFGDGSANVTLQNPLHRYNLPGNYTVMLNASTSTTYDRLTRVEYVVVSAVGPTPTPTGPTLTPTPTPINASNVSPFSMTAQRGETWIKWSWKVQPEYSGKYVTMQAVIDGEVVYQQPLWDISTSEIPETYTLDGINSQEEHKLTLDLIDNVDGTVLVHDSLKLETITDSSFYLMLFGVAIALLLIAVYLGKGLVPFVLSVLSIIIALYLVVSLQEHNKEFAIVVTIFAVFAGFLIVSSVYKMAIARNDWSE